MKYIRIKITVFLLFLFSTFNICAEDEISLTLGGTESAYRYTAELLTRVLESEGYKVLITYVGFIPTTRLEYMMEKGGLSCFILGKTEARSQRFLPVDVGMTNNLMGQRILFIRPELQKDFDSVYTLEDLQTLGVVCGMGKDWGDIDIWKYNDLSVETVVGDWRKLYNMVSAGNRNIDYLSRGAQEILQEYTTYPNLAVEENLVLVYKQDHILYVSPKYSELHRILSQVMEKAEQKGLISQVAREFFSEVYEPPINLDKRRVIPLELPD
jgi:hypothetical protein